LDFIFVATCHSEFAAEIFYDNGEGASHVIGIDKGYTINDDAAITFAKSFYSRVWLRGSKICEVFEQARTVVRLNFPR
jgi:hypothetical protein